MGGLVNGRRGGRSPPLLIGALIACVLVLGFNYWVSSSRNLELQTQLFQMEGEVRRTAAEKASVEQKKKVVEEELRMKNDQISRMEGSHRIQLEALQADWKQDRTVLGLNISFSSKTIQALKAQLSGLEETQKDLRDCQNNRINLSSAMNQCEVQMSALKKECAAKSSEKPPSASASLSFQEKSGTPLNQTGSAERTGLDDTKKPSVPALKMGRTITEPGVTNGKLTALETNEIATNRGKSDITQQEPKVGETKRGNLEMKDLEVMETHGGKQLSTGNDAALVEKGDKPVDQHDDRPGDKPADKPGDVPGDQQNAAGSEAVGQSQLKANTGKDPASGRASPNQKDKPADYNGDDDNEGEFEADKQAELAKH